MNILIATNNPAKAREIHAVLADAAFSPAHLSPLTSLTASPSLSLHWLSLADLAAPIPEPEETGSSFLQNATLKALHYARLSGLYALADDSGLEVDALGGEPGVHSAYFDRTAAHLPRPARDAANNAKLVAAIRDVPPDRRTARYHCVMVLAGPKCLPPDTEPQPPGSIGLRPVRITTPPTNDLAPPTSAMPPPTGTDHPPPGDPAPLPAPPPGSIGLRPVRITTQPTNDATNDVTVLATAHGHFEGLILDQPRGLGGFGYDPYFLIPDLQMTAAELPAPEKNRISHRGQALRAMSQQIEMLRVAQANSR